MQRSLLQNTKRLDIQILRAIAIVSVVIFHFNENLLKSGFLGVDIFFVISGYLMTKIINDAVQSNNFDLIQFYISRIKRIIPAYSLILLITILVASVLFLPSDFKHFIDSFNSAIAINSNSYFSSFGSYFAPSKSQMPLLHTWSLSIELQFYLLIPLVLLIFGTSSRLLFFVLIVTLSIYSSYTIYFDGSLAENYFNTLGRLPQFLVGGWLYFIEKNHSSNKGYVLLVIGVATLITSYILIDSSSFYPGLLGLVPCLGVAFIVYSASLSKIPILNSKFTLFVGDLSYSLYLWHWPVLAFSRYISDNYELSAYMNIFALTITIILSLLSYYLIEKKVKISNGFQALTLVASVFIILASSQFLSGQVNKSFDLNNKIELTRYAPPNKICHSKKLPSCIISKANSDNPETSILIIGDSHAAHLYEFAKNLVSNLDIRVELISGSSCMTYPNFNYSHVPEFAKESCIKQIELAESKIPEHDILILAGKWTYHRQKEAFKDSLINFLQSQQKPIYVFAQIPKLKSSTQKKIRLTQIGFNQAIQIDDEYKDANLYISEVIKDIPNAKFLNFNNIPLFVSPPFYKGTPVYFDAHHLNQVGSKIYGEQTIDTFKQLLINEAPHSQTGR